MTILHSGSTKKFSTGWETVFSKKARANAKPKTKSKPAPPKKKPAKKRAR